MYQAVDAWGAYMRYSHNGQMLSPPSRAPQSFELPEDYHNEDERPEDHRHNEETPEPGAVRSSADEHTYSYRRRPRG